jgi:Activator of Hsp90 ATPase homolog 1-like protein
MLRGLASGRCPVTGIGDEFVMNMNQEGLGDYQMRSEVVDFEPNRRIVWAPALHPPGALRDKLGDIDPSGYVWSWELEPTATGGTRLTLTYDWNGVRDARALPLFPRVSEEQMAASIALIATACADSVRPNGDRGGQG